MKKTKKPEPVQLDFWGNPKPPKKLKKAAAFNTERALVVQMLNEAKKKETK